MYEKMETIYFWTKNPAYAHGRHWISRPMRTVSSLPWRDKKNEDVFKNIFWGVQTKIVGRSKIKIYWFLQSTKFFWRGVSFFIFILQSREKFRRAGDQWEARNWSCDLRANERPRKKLQPMAQTHKQTHKKTHKHTHTHTHTWRLYDWIGPVKYWYFLFNWGLS